MLVSTLNHENYLEIKDIKFDVNNSQNYLRRFDELKTQLKIRKECNFFSKEWIYVVGGVEIKILFPDELLIKKIANKYGKTYKNINIGYRYFILEKMVTNSRIKDGNTLIKRVFNIGIENLKDLIKDNLIQYLAIVLELYEFLDLDDSDEIEDLLACQYNYPFYYSKKLPNLLSIFEFTEIIDEFYHNATIEELKEFYPIILWWKITTIIPLRPSEFLVMDYNCLIKDNDKYYIELRRSNSKDKGLIRNISEIGDFYRKDTIQINKNTYELVKNYMKFVEKHIPEHKKELLISDVFLENKRILPNWNSNRKLNKEIFTANDFYYLLNQFNKKIIGVKMGKLIVDKKDENIEFYRNLDNCIERVNPYDSRHIAIINLIIMGNEPLTVMRLAGHSKIQTTQGYYNHIEEYVNAYSISYAKKLKKKFIIDNDFIPRENSSAQTTMNLIFNKNNHIKVDGGRCTYNKISYNDFTQCYRVEGNHLICPYFIPDNISDVENQIRKCNESISNQVKLLKDLVRDKTESLENSKKYAILSEQLRQEIINLSMANSKK